MKIRTIIADDHSIVRNCIRTEIETIEWIQVTSEVSSPHELVAELWWAPCDLLIMDFNMSQGPTEDGLAMLDCILERYLDLPIIVLTMVTQADMLRAIYKRAVSGLVSKNDSLGAISAAVRAVSVGRRYISATVQSKLRSHLLGANGHIPPPSSLSEPELRVLRLFVSGRSFGEIAALLGSSMGKVAQLKIEAMRKLDIRSDLDLYGYAMRQGFSV
ncbi:response regulator transcription factor [Dyella terrae]|uniref:response regulator transcription factor n=1 Tax=Dyella terrae TaxID=522259 RepID=UPI001EFE68F5|nr:response regulator transcription factor [Dyella terrae]ULU26223.1 response regulator transcription factor [Dyella terrae]